MNEEKILYNVLKAVGTGEEYKMAPDKEYLNALNKIGLITLEWENQLTEFGREILSMLRNKIEEW
jgi:hypothetical protein